MEAIVNSQADAAMQLGLFQSIMDLLLVNPIFLWGIVFIAVPLVVVLKKARNVSKTKIILLSFVMYYYLCITLEHIVGMPTLKEYIRLLQLGETFFNPKLNLIPFSDGFSLSFILNILLFMPLGFLCPFISKHYENIKTTFWIGFGFSFFIEIAQLFTLHRATDINDLLTNITGTIIGYLCSKWILSKKKKVKFSSEETSKGKDHTVYIPVIIIIVASIFVFFS